MRRGREIPVNLPDIPVAKTPLSVRLLTHADSMQSEGWYTTANALAEAAEAVADWRPADMTANQYRKALETLEMSQAKAAEFLGLSLRSSQGYALGEYPVPEAIAKLLRLMIRLKLKPDDVK
jgi:hypothetical protein